MAERGYRSVTAAEALAGAVQAGQFPQPPRRLGACHPLPDAEDGSKQGLDDFVACHGRRGLLLLVDDAEPWAWGSEKMVRHLQAEVRELRRQLSEQAAVMRNP